MDRRRDIRVRRFGGAVPMIAIDSEFQALIPPLDEDEYQRLEKSILTDGYHEWEPIVTWNGTIVDGHNRYHICDEHGIKPTQVEREFDSRDAAKSWIIEHQLGRRNLPTAAIGLLKLEEKKIEARQAKKRMMAGKPDPTPNLGEGTHGGETLEKLARDIPLGRESLRKLDVIKTKAEEGDPVAIRERDALKSGEKKSIHGAYIRVTGKSKTRTKDELLTTDGRYICLMCGEPIDKGEANAAKPYVHQKCISEYQRDWKHERMAANNGSNEQNEPKLQKTKHTTKKAEYTEDGRRICTVCGKPINDGEAYEFAPSRHKECRQAALNQGQYKNPDKSLLENVATYTTQSLVTELTSTAERMREAIEESITINETMGVSLTKAQKRRLSKALDNVLKAITSIEG